MKLLPPICLFALFRLSVVKKNNILSSSVLLLWNRKKNKLLYSVTHKIRLWAVCRSAANRTCTCECAHTHTGRSLDRKHPIPFYSHNLKGRITNPIYLLVSLPSSTVTDQAGCQFFCKRLHIEAYLATGGVKSKRKPRMSAPPCTSSSLVKPRKHLVSVQLEGFHCDKRKNIWETDMRPLQHVLLWSFFQHGTCFFPFSHIIKIRFQEDLVDRSF